MVREVRHLNTFKDLRPKSRHSCKMAYEFCRTRLAHRRSRTGLEVHPHLFRHLAAKLHLEAHPGDYETVRRLLGHKKMDTTVGFYAPISTKAAYASYAKVLNGYGRGTDVRW